MTTSHSTPIAFPWRAVHFAIAGASLGALSTFERLLHHGYAYTAVSAALLHLSVAVCVSLLLGMALGGLVDLFDAVLGPRTPLRLGVLSALGAGAGFAAHVAVVWPSKYGDALPRVPAAVGVGLVSGGVAWLALRSVVPAVAERRALVRGVGSTLLLGILWVDLHAYQRSYGNVHVLLSALALLVAAIVASTLPWRARSGRRTALVVLAVSLAGATWLPTTQAARGALLGLGGVEKVVVKHVLWPLLDRDGDGASAALLGTDCDDHDARVAPLRWPVHSPTLGCVPLPPPAAPAGPVGREPPEPRLDLVWIVVDTWRTDTPAQLPDWARSFTRLENYRSCGSRTEQVVEQLFGAHGCPRTVAARGLVSWLGQSGYELVQLGEYSGLVEGFGRSQRLGTREALASSAKQWLSTAASRPRFTVVHFKGGHADYAGTGASSRERYDDAIARTLREVGELVAVLPRDTVVVVAGDHGEEFGEHGSVSHALSLYEEVLRTPAWIRAPGLAPGPERRAMGCAQLVDYTAALVAGEPVEAMGGGDAFAILHSPKGVHGGLSESRSFAVIAPDGTKLIWEPVLDLWELYDLESDPGERWNLADARPQQLRQAAVRLSERILACAGPYGFTR